MSAPRMQSLLVRVSLTLCVLFFKLVHADRVEAAGDFNISFKSTYQVEANATTTVTHEVLMENKKPNIYASEYSVSVGSTNIQSVRSFDETGILSASVATVGGLTSITVNLASRPTVGEGKTKQLTIQYQNGDIASRIGNVVEVNIPKISNDNEFDEYNTVLVVPTSIGEISHVVPAPTSSELVGGQHIYQFNNHRETGITAVFGKSQLFSVDLSYYLTGNSPKGAFQTITLIPDTAYQRVDYVSLTPKPVSIDQDDDGNWIAQFPVSSGQTLRVDAHVAVEVFMTASVNTPMSQPASYLGPSQYWQTEDKEIQDLARSLGSVKSIYDFVRGNLQYNYKRAEQGSTRMGAKLALASPSQAICTEFTDLFIALSRASGIPARELNGFAYTENPKLRPLSLTKDILHAWPEYWDSTQDQWTPVDPTWGNTTGGIDYFNKLDLNHIVFAIHGQSPISPLPAGFYKTSPDQGKTISVVPITEKPKGIVRLDVETNLPKKIPSYLPTDVIVAVTNRGTRAAYHVPITISSPLLVLDAPAEIPVILPMQKVSLSLRIQPRTIWGNQTYSFTITIGDSKQTYDIDSTPPITWEQAGAFAISLTIILGLFVTVKLWNIHLQRSTQQPDVRREVKKS